MLRLARLLWFLACVGGHGGVGGDRVRELRENLLIDAIVMRRSVDVARHCFLEKLDHVLYFSRVSRFRLDQLVGLFQLEGGRLAFAWVLPLLVGFLFLLMAVRLGVRG